MKTRIVVISAVLLLAAYGVATWQYSAHAEASALESLKRVTTAAPYLKASQDYQRGFFKSTQDIAVALPVPGEGGRPVSVTLRNVIHHGPLPRFSGVGIARVEHSLVFDDSTAKEVAKAFGGAAPLAAVTHIDFSGGGHTELKGAPGSYQGPAGAVTWQGLSGTLRFTNALSSYSGDIAAPGATLAGKDGSTASLNALSLKAEQVRMPDTANLYLGTMNLRVQSVTMAKGGKTEFEVKNVVMGSGVTSKELGFLDVAGRIGAGEFTSAALSGTNAEYAFSVRRLHAPSLDRLSTAMQESRRSADANPAAAQAALQQVFAQHGLALLRHEPVVAIESLGFTSKDGETKLSGTAKIVGVTDADLANPIGLLAKADVQATIKVAEALLKAFMSQAALKAMRAQGREPTAEEMAQLTAQQLLVYDAKVGELIAAGSVVREGATLSAKLTFKDGLFLVNGKPLPEPPAR